MFVSTVIPLINIDVAMLPQPVFGFSIPYNLVRGSSVKIGIHPSEWRSNNANSGKIVVSSTDLQITNVISHFIPVDVSQTISVRTKEFVINGTGYPTPFTIAFNLEITYDIANQLIKFLPLSRRILTGYQPEGYNIPNTSPVLLTIYTHQS